MEYLEKLCNKKAKENNTIDLNAYAIGIEDSKAPEMLEMLIELKEQIIRCDFDEMEWHNKVEQLIKEATEL